MKIYYFEKLEVWQESIELSVLIYKMVEKLPSSEKFGLISQITRASTSISANIAEGMSRNTNKDKARFINNAFGSTVEVLNFLILVEKLGFINNDDYLSLRQRIESITNKLNSLYKKLLE